MAQEEFLDRAMPDVIEQWRFYFSVLQPGNGDAIIDVGCDTGDAERLLLREYPDVAKVVGVESAPKRYEYACAKRAKDGSPARFELKLADAQNLPFPDNCFDRAMCVETLEWVKQPLRALQEIKRVLKPGGTAVVIHSDFDTQIFNSADVRLSRKIIAAFADSGPDGQIGRKLYGMCRKAGFTTVKPVIYTLVNTEWKPDLYAYRMAHMMAEWLLKNQAVTKDEIESWLAGLEARRSAGDFFYSVNRYICRCLK